MRGYFRKKIALILLALIFVLPILPVGATQATREQLRELERQLAATGQQVSEQENILAGTEFEMSQVLLEMQALDQQIVDAEDTLDAIEFDLLMTELRIAEAEEDLEAARAERDSQMEILRERVRVMHEKGQVGLLEVLFQAESIADFFSRWEYMRTVSQFDRELVARLENSEERIATNVEFLNANRVLILDLQAQVVRARRDIELRMDEREIFFAALYADAERHAEFLAILEEEQRLINIDFGIVQARYQAEVAEEQRRRQAEQDAQRAAAAAAAAQERSVRLATLNSFDDFTWPLAIQGRRTSEFGYRNDPFSGRQAWHSGTDIAAPGGTHIFAAEAGYVRFAGWNAGFGNYIILDHADGYSTLYAHNTRNHVVTGQRVSRGQHIGDVGTTGRSTGNHLHFEIRLNGVHLNPMSYFGG